MERGPQSNFEHNEGGAEWRELHEQAISEVESELAARLEGLEVAGTRERLQVLREMVAGYSETVPGTQLPANNDLRFHAEYACALLKAEEEAALEAGEVPVDDASLQFQLSQRQMAEAYAMAANDNRADEDARNAA